MRSCSLSAWGQPTHPPTVQSVSQSVSAETAVNAARLKLFDADTASCSEQHARLTLVVD